LAGFFSSFLASALAGAVALAAGAAGLTSSFLAAGAWANADTANNDATTIAIADFILKFPLCYTQRIVPAYIYNAVAYNSVDN
jgi:hypothetical protein